MKKKRSLRVAFFALAAMVFSAATLLGVNPPPQNFPLMGIALGQTLRLNALATPGGAGCVATLGFVDQNGGAVPQPPAPNINLLPGQAAFADFPAQLVLTQFGQRIELRPVVSFPASGATDCLFEAEIFDQASGFSQMIAKPPNPNLPGQTPAPFSLMGLAFGQVLRPTAVAASGGLAAPGLCVVTLGFVDQNGVSMRSGPGPISLSINPGQGTFLDLPASLLVSTFGQRAQVRPVVLQVASVPGQNACAGVVAAAETFDTFSGRTWVVDVVQGPGPVN